MRKRMLFFCFGLTLTVSLAVLKTRRPDAVAMAQTPPDLSKVSLRASITLPDELPDFKADQVNSRHFTPRKIVVSKALSALPTKPPPAAWLVSGDGASVYFIRLSDQMTIDVDVSLCTTEADTTALTDQARETQSGPIPEGSFSKRALGQHVYSFPAQNGKFPAGSNRIIVQDGRSLVVVSATTQIQNVNGRPVFVELPPQYVTLCEDIALRVLDRLTFLGHTSKPANTASKAAQQQVLDWIAAHPDIATSKP